MHPYMDSIFGQCVSWTRVDTVRAFLPVPLLLSPRVSRTLGGVVLPAPAPRRTSAHPRPSPGYFRCSTSRYKQETTHTSQGVFKLFQQRWHVNRGPGLDSQANFSKYVLSVSNVTHVRCLSVPLCYADGLHFPHVQ